MSLPLPERPLPEGLPPERLLLPFAPGPFRMAMALVACPPARLIEIDDRYRDAMAERRGLLATSHAAVFATTPGSEAARAETLALLASLLVTHHPTWFDRHGTQLRNHLTGEAWDLANPPYDPLELAGRLVQEDLCLLDLASGAPVLSAAVLCAPTRWRLDEKLGRPLADIHGPVPIYAERLAAPVDRFMAALRPGKVVERVNWSVIDDGALFQTSGKHRTGRNPAVTAGNAPDTLFLRTERQTLTALPQSGAVLFAIHVRSTPLRQVLARPGAAADLAAAIRALPDSMASYKSMPTIAEALLQYLDHAATA